MLWIGIHDVPLGQPLTVLLGASVPSHRVVADNFDKPSERGEVASETQRGFDELRSRKGLKDSCPNSVEFLSACFSGLALLTIFMNAEPHREAVNRQSTSVKHR